MTDRNPARTGLTRRTLMKAAPALAAPVLLRNQAAGQESASVPAGMALVLTPEGVWPADGKIHPGTETWPCSNSSVDGLFLGVQTGAWAVGMPPNPWHLDQHCSAPGQARSVAALWLGAQSSPGAAKALAKLPGESGRNAAGELAFDDWTDPPAWGVTWSAADVAAALALLDRPAADVAAVLDAGWDRFTDPATPSSELLAQAGVPAGASGSPVAAGTAGTCP